MACEIKDPTNNPLCSDSLKDLKDNAIIMDQYINSEEFEVPDRLGIPRKTWAGIEKEAQDNIDGFEDLINDKILAAGGVEFAEDWGDSPNKAMGQKFLSDLENNIGLSSTFQSHYFAEFLLKIRTGVDVVINCVGTSITEGYDTTSDDKRPPLHSGQTIASVTYPEKLQEILREVYNRSNITVNNYGWSGDYIERAYNRWTDLPTCDLTIFEYGANDANPANNVPIANFLKYFELFIVRQIKKGSSVIICGPSKMANANNMTRESYQSALYALADKYSINVIDTELLLKNCDESFYSDSVHLNGKGYSYLGSRISATIVGSGIQSPKYVCSGSKLLSRQTIDSIVYGKNSSKTVTNSTGITPSEVSLSGGIVSTMRGQDGESLVTYAIYAQTDDLCVIPNIQIRPNSSVEVVIDSGLGSPQSSISFAIGVISVDSDSDNRYAFTNNSIENITNNIQDNRMGVINLKTEGWHIIRVYVRDAVSYLYGMQFVDYQVFKDNFYSHIINDGESVTTIDINNILHKFNFLIGNSNPWKNPCLKFTFTSVVHCITRSNILFGQLNSSFYWKKVGENEIIHASLDNIHREIDSVSLDGNSLKINWSGDYSIRGVLSVTLG